MEPKKNVLIELAELIAESNGMSLIKNKPKEQPRSVLFKEFAKKPLSELDRELSKINSEIAAEEARNKQTISSIVDHLRNKEQIEDWNSHVIQISGMGKGKVIRADTIDIENDNLSEAREIKELIESALLLKKKEELFERIKFNIQGIKSGTEVQDTNGGKKWRFKI